MKKNIFICMMILIHLQAKAQIEEGALYYLKGHLQKLRTEFNVPALCATLVIDGKIVAFDATGFRKNGNGTKVTANDLFAVGSVTKTITGFLSAKIIQDNPGLLSWTTRIRDVYPELVGLQGLNNDGLNSTIQNLNRFTVQVSASHCLSHASCALNNFSGINVATCCQPNTVGFPENCNKNNLATYQTCGRDEFVHKMMKLPVAAIVDGKFPYNNNSPVIVSAMLQRVKDSTYENLLRQHFFVPLGMQKAKLISQVTNTEADLIQVPFGHDGNNASDYFKSDNNRFHIGHASGGIMMTPKEMGTYLIEVIPGAEGRKGLLTDANLTNYFSGFTNANPKANGGWFSVTVGDKVSGFAITNENAFWHNGGLAGFSSDFLVIPMKKFGYACVTTGDPAVLSMLKNHLVNMWYQKNFLPFVPVRNNTSLSNAQTLELLTDDNFLTTWSSPTTNDAIIAKTRNRGVLSSPFRYVLLAYPRNNHNITKIQIFAKDNNNIEHELKSSSPGADNTLFIFDENVFAKELRIQFTNSNNKKTVLSEIRVMSVSNDRQIVDPIEKIMDPIRKIVDPVVKNRMNIISVQVPQGLKGKKQ